MERNYNNSTGVSYISGFFILIGLALLGLVVSSFFTLALLSFTGGNAAAIKEAINDPKNADLIRLSQAVSVVVSMVIPALITALMLNHKPVRLLGFKKDVSLTQLGLVITIMFCALFVAGGLAYLNKNLAQAIGWGSWAETLEKTYNEQVVVMMDLKSSSGYLTSILIMAFLPAVAEEMLFRGGLQNFLTRAIRMPWLSILVVSLLFSLVHFSVYGFLVRFFLGIVLGYIFYYTGNLWLSITAHFFNNALAVTTIFLFARQGKSIEEAMSKEVSPSYWGLLALPVVIWLFIALLKNTRKTQSGSAE